MAILMLQAAPFIRMLAPKLSAAYRRFLRALDGFAEARMRSAVPQWVLRRTDHIERVRGAHADARTQARASRAKRLP